MYNRIEKHTANYKRYIPKIGGDFNAELGPGHGTECICVGRYTLNEGNKRGYWNYILTKRRYLRHNKDAEANDMIQMGSDHRCVMATFTVTMLGKNNHHQNTREKHDMIEYEERDQAEKTLKSRSLSLKRIPRDHRKKKKKPPPQKKQQRNQKVKTQKHKRKRKKQQQQEQIVKMLKRKQKKSKECAKESQ